MFKSAMLKTVREVLGVGYTPETEKSWSETIDVILELMKSGATAETQQR